MPAVKYVKAVLKFILRMIPVVIAIAVIAGAAYIALEPEAGERLWAMVNSRNTDERILLELETGTEEPVMSYEMPGELLFYQDVDWDLHETVYTWFRDTDGDLWLPMSVDMPEMEYGAASVLNRQGVVLNLGTDVIQADPRKGTLFIPRESIETLSEGDYYICILVSTETWQRYYIYPLMLRDECTFRSTQAGIAARGESGDYLVNADREDEVTMHFYNLGENKVTRVLTVAESGVMGEYVDGFPLSEEQYVISEDGHSVTFTAEYVSTWSKYAPYYFTYELGDGTEIRPHESENRLGIVLHDDGWDLPYTYGPVTYSLSSGEDYVFYIHQGSEGLYESDGSGITFDCDESCTYFFDKGLIGEDDSYTVPAEVFLEAAERGAESAWIGPLFGVEITYYRGSGYSVALLP